MEAAIGIEPMNKGFADPSKHVSLSIMEHHRRVNIGFFHLVKHSMILHRCRYYPQKSPHWIEHQKNCSTTEHTDFRHRFQSRLTL